MKENRERRRNKISTISPKISNSALYVHAPNKNFQIFGWNAGKKMFSVKLGPLYYFAEKVVRKWHLWLKNAAFLLAINIW